MQRGYLILIGGAENNSNDSGILKHILDVTRAVKIVLIPTASCYPRDVHRDYGDTFNVLNIPETTCLDIRDAREADEAHCLAALEEADLVYFSGGDQVRLVSKLVHTELLDRIRARFASGSLHIAGTSAGAAAAGNPMIYDGITRGLSKVPSDSWKDSVFSMGSPLTPIFRRANDSPGLRSFLSMENVKKGSGSMRIRESWSIPTMNSRSSVPTWPSC